MSQASEYQPKPKHNGEIVLPYVLADIQERADFGYQKHGGYLNAHNGRDALWDAYQEAIDLVFYLRQAIIERHSGP